MLDYVWLILLFPLAGVLINAILGRWLSRRVVAIIASLAVGASFVVAVLVFIEMLGLPAESRAAAMGGRGSSPLFTWIVAGDFVVEAGILLDQLSILMVLVVTGVSTLIHIYSAGYMEGDEYYQPLLYLAEPLCVHDAHPGAGRQFRDHVRRLGRGGPLLLPAHRLLVRKGSRRPTRARRPSSSTVSAILALPWASCSSLPPLAVWPFQDVFPAAGTHPARHGHGHRAAAVPGCYRQVGPDPALRLVARCHGGSHAGQRPHPRGDDGHGRRLYGGPLLRHL